VLAAESMLLSSQKDIEVNHPKYNGKDVEFRSKHEQSVAMLCEIGVYAYLSLSVRNLIFW
jgi:hypothetical protein